MPAKLFDEHDTAQLHSDMRELLWKYGARTKGDQIKVLAELIAILGPTHKGRELYRSTPDKSKRLIIERTGRFDQEKHPRDKTS